MTNGINLDYLNKKVRESGMKKNSLAERVNLSYQGLHNKMIGRRDFSSEEIRAIAKALNLSADEILGIFFTDYVDKTSTKGRA